MPPMFTKMELQAIARYLKKVYPGVAEQDELYALIQKIEHLSRGKHGTGNRGSGDRQ